MTLFQLCGHSEVCLALVPPLGLDKCLLENYRDWYSQDFIPVQIHFTESIWSSWRVCSYSRALVKIEGPDLGFHSACARVHWGPLQDIYLQTHSPFVAAGGTFIYRLGAFPSHISSNCQLPLYFLLLLNKLVHTGLYIVVIIKSSIPSFHEVQLSVWSHFSRVMTAYSLFKICYSVIPFGNCLAYGDKHKTFLICRLQSAKGSLFWDLNEMINSRLQR